MLPLSIAKCMVLRRLKTSTVCPCDIFRVLCSISAAVVLLVVLTVVVMSLCVRVLVVVDRVMLCLIPMTVWPSESLCRVCATAL